MGASWSFISGKQWTCRPRKILDRQGWVVSGRLGQAGVAKVLSTQAD